MEFPTKYIPYLFIGFMIITLPSVVLGQRARYKPQVHELGIQLGQLTYIGSQASTMIGNAGPVQALPINGLRYKYHVTMDHGIRLSGFLQRNRFEVDGSFLREFDQANYRAGTLQLGYEYKYHRGPHQTFVGVDLVGQQGTMRNDFTRCGVASCVVLDQSIMQRKYGLALVGGYSFFLGKHISVTLEGQAQYLRVNAHNPLNLNPEGVAPYVLPEQEWGLSVSAYISLHGLDMPKRCACPRH